MRFRRGIVLVCSFAAAAGLFLAAGCSNLAWYRHGESSRWAAADDPVAKTMIDAERKWAEAGCDHNGIAQTILAEDFHAVAPDGSEYGKFERQMASGEVLQLRREVPFQRLLTTGPIQRSPAVWFPG